MTISDIAKMAGVSSAAVSRYLNGGPLSEQKRAVIHEVVEKTGYRPDTAAQTLRTGKVNQVGVIAPSIGSQSVGQITAGIASELDAKSYLMLLGNTELDAQRELGYLTAMQRNHVAGIILLGSYYTPQLAQALKNCRVPVVVTGQRFQDVACVYNDDRTAARELAQRMLDHGRKRIVYIGGTERDDATGVQRREGVQDALNAAGLNGEQMPRICCNAFTMEEGQRCMQELLVRCPDLDGVVCVTDTVAFGAMRALREAGRHVGQDVGLAGVGDSWAGSMMEPGLATVRFYQKQVGQEAAACAVLGACLGAGRAFFPVRGRGALLPDVLLMGGLLLGTQSYAASLSAGGVPRWYMLAAAIAGIALAEHLLGVPLRAVGRVLRRPLDGLAKYAAAHAQARAARKKAAKERRNEKRLAKKPKKNLPSERRVLYNSNVSK